MTDLLNTDDYIRKQVFDYLMDSGMTAKDAMTYMNRIGQARIVEIYDSEPYFEEEGK